MSAEMSFEDFFAAGTGAEPTEKFVISSEGFDGYSDNVMAEAEQALENLNFLDSFEAVSKMNAESKIRMLQKIKNNYNSKTIGRESLGMSIESLCAGQIQSLEDAMADKAPEGDKAKTEDKPATDSKVKKFAQTVWNAIKEFFQKIADFFANIGRSIAKFFSKFKKVEKDVDPTVVAAATAGASGEEKAIVNAAAKASLVNATVESVNTFRDVSAKLEKISRRVSTVADKMAKANVAVGQDSMALQKSVSEFLKKTAKVQMLYGKAFNQLSKAAANTIRLNNVLSNWKKAKENEGKSEAEIKEAGLKKFLKAGDLYIVDGKFNAGISNTLVQKSGAMSAALEKFVSGKITKQDDPQVVELRKLSEEINKLVLGDKASYDISTIDSAAFTVSKLFGVKVSFVKGTK